MNSRVVLSAAALAVFVTTFDITAVVMIMPGIRRDLGLELSAFAWLMDAFSLAYAVSLMAAGVLADRFGRRGAFLAGTAVFAAASAACAAAAHPWQLLAGRAGQGVGAAFALAAGVALVSQANPQGPARARAFAWMGVVNGLAMALGPVGGGAIAAAWGWQWVFWLNVPIGLLLIVVTWRHVHESRDPQGRGFDAGGVLWLSLLLLSLVWLPLHGPRVGAQTVPLPLALAGMAALAALFVRSQRRALHPLLPPRLLREQGFLALALVQLALSVGYWAVLVYFPLFLQEQFGQALSAASLQVLAVTLPMALVPLLSVRAAIAAGTPAFFAGGLALVALGGGVLAAGAWWHSLPLALTGMLLASTGTAAVSAQALAATVAAVPPEQAGAASAFAIIVRQGSFGVGIALLAGVGAQVGLSGSDAHAGFAAVFAVAAATAAGAAPLVYALLRRRAS